MHSSLKRTDGHPLLQTLRVQPPRSKRLNCGSIVMSVRLAAPLAPNEKQRPAFTPPTTCSLNGFEKFEIGTSRPRRDQGDRRSENPTRYH